MKPNVTALEIDARPEAPDLNDLAESHDILGTQCTLHHTVRFLDEAPVVQDQPRDGDVVIAKRNLFPNSWAAVVSHVVPGERRNRTAMITVRYCPECRAAADRWFREHRVAELQQAAS